MKTTIQQNTRLKVAGSKLKAGMRNAIGIILLGMLGVAMHFGLHWHAEGIFFWLFFVSLFYWKIDSRVSIGLALAGLVLIMILLALSDAGIAPSWRWGDNITTMHLDALAEKVAVWVYFFLVIGVVKQIWEFKVESKNVKSEKVESRNVESKKVESRKLKSKM